MKWRKSGKIVFLLITLLTISTIGCQQGTESTQGGTNVEQKTDGQGIRLQPASWQEKGFWASHIDNIAEYVNEQSKNVVVEPTMPGSIVPVDKQIDAVQSGSTPAMCPPAAYLAGRIPVGYVWSTPPYVQNVVDMMDFNESYEGGRAGQIMKEEIERVYPNVVVVGYMYGAADTLISSTVALPDIASLNGLKLRVGAGLVAETLTHFGAKTVFAPASEIYTMLSNKTIDATVMGSPADHINNSFQEVTKYWVRKPALNAAHATIFCINKGVWEQMTSEDQKILTDAIAHSNEKILAVGQEEIDNAWVEAENQGISIEEWNDVEQKEWHLAFYEQAKAYSDDEAYADYMSLLEKWAEGKGYK